MAKLNYVSNFNIDDKQVNVGLSVIQFKEDETYIIYSPALDLSGYGNTVKEAKMSFDIALKEFVKYTSNKKTLEKVLVKLGWKIKGHKLTAPLNTDLIKRNSLYSDIVNNKKYSSFNQNIAFAF